MGSNNSPVLPSVTKKWPVFFVILMIVAAVLAWMLKPGGEAEAAELLERARLINAAALSIAEKSGETADLNHAHLSSAALRKAENLMVESDYASAMIEAQMAIDQAEDVLDRGLIDVTIEGDGRFREVYGTVQIRKKEKLNLEPITRKQTLEAGDSLVTATASACLVFYANKTRVVVLDNTKVELLPQGGGDGDQPLLDFGLQRGGLLFKTSDLLGRGRIRVVAPSRQVWIYRNTDVLIRQNFDGSLEIRVGEGRADLEADGRPFPVRENQALRLADGASPGAALDLPSSPPLKGPANFFKFEGNQNGFAAVTLEWGDGRGATAYHIELCENRLFVGSSEVKTNYVGNKATFPGISEGIYFWRISGIDANGQQGMPSRVRQFQVDSATVEEDSVIRDTSPPRLEIVDVDIQGSVVIIRGVSEKDATIIVQDERAFLDEEDGTFRHVATLPGKGVYTIDIVAIDRAGNRSFKEVPIEIKE